MSRSAQNLLLIVLGAAVGWITLSTGEYVNYVKPGLGLPLAAAAVVLIALGAAGLRREWRAGDRAEAGDGCSGGHAEGHPRGPRVAWLLCLPLLAVFLIAPPALGSFTADRKAGRAAPPPAPAEGYGTLRATGGPIDMTMGEFIGRSFEAQTGQPNGLPAVQVRLTGFVAARKGDGWYVTRLKMACCAGDAIPFQVLVRGPARPPGDSWVRVVGRWAPPATAAGGGGETMTHELRGETVQPIKKPKNAYE